MFERLKLIIGEDNLIKIQSKNILVIGLGGVGGSLVEGLVRSGISNIILIDFDVVEESNINRQKIATIKTIGMKKTVVMGNFIKEINPNCNTRLYDLLVGVDNIKNLFDEHNIDYVLDACDDVNAKKLIIKECIDRNIKFVSSMGTGNKINPALLEITDIKNTVNDPLARIFRKWAKDNNLEGKITVLSSKELPCKTGNVVGSTCFVPNSAGLLIASYVINDIIKD